MTTQLYNPVHEIRIRGDIRAMLEYHILEELSLREACRRAGLKYTKNASQHKFSKASKAYVAQLKRRRRVIVEFGVDEPCLATLLELRDLALKAGSFTAASKATVLCIRVAGNSDRKWEGAEKEISEMSRAEVMAKISQLTLKANGRTPEYTEDPLITELRESLGRTQKT